VERAHQDALGGAREGAATRHETKPGSLEAVQREDADAEEAVGRVEAKPDPPSSAGYACG
jgi:hypothetical protein